MNSVKFFSRRVTVKDSEEGARKIKNWVKTLVLLSATKKSSTNILRRFESHRSNTLFTLRKKENSMEN